MHPNSMMFIHGIDNNILNYGASFLRVYQEEYKMKELYQDIIILVWNQKKKMKSGGAIFSVNIYF